MTRWGKALFEASAFTLALGGSRSYAGAAPEGQAVAVLVQRYETVVSARSNVLSRLDFYSPSNHSDAKDLGLPFIDLIGGLKPVGPNTLSLLEGASDTVLTGAKDFVGPTPGSLGMVSARTCTIAILVNGAAQTLASEFSEVKVQLIDGRPVWTWSIPPYEGHPAATVFYAAVVTSSFFVLANDREDFRDVAKTLATGKAQADALSARQDLTSLRAHPYWAYRAIRRTKTADSSPPGVNELPRSAVGLKLFTEFDDGKLFFDILAPDGPSVPAGLPTSDAIRFQPAGVGVWRALIALAPTKPTYAVLRTLSYFGYGLII